MADSTVEFDMSVLGKALGDMDKASSASMSRKTGGDVAALASISARVAKVLTDQATVQEGVEKLDKDLSRQQAQVFTAGAEEQRVAGASAGALSTQAGSAALEAQAANIATIQAADLNPNDPLSILRQSIDTFNTYTDSAKRDRIVEMERNNRKWGDVITGNASFGDVFHAKFIDPAKRYDELASSKEKIAALEQNRIRGLQGLVSGQLAVNTAAQVSLTEDGIRQQAVIEQAKYGRVADELQIKALITGSEYLKRVQALSSHKQSVALSKGGLDVSIENSKRASESFELNKGKLSPEDYAAQVRLGAKFLGNKGADNMTAEFISKYGNTAGTKADLDTLAQLGILLSGHAVVNPDAALPNVLGSPGEAVYTLERTRGNLPAGMTVVQKHLQALASDTGVDPMSKKPLKPSERAAFINAKAEEWFAVNAADIDKTELYGKPHVADIITSATFQTPELAGFAEKVLKPFAAKGNNPLMNEIVYVARTSGLPQNEINYGLHQYALAARAHRDAVAQPAAVGLRSAADVPYTARVDTGSLFGTSESVDFSNLASVISANNRYNAYKAAKKSSITILDAAVMDIALPGAKK